MNSPVVNPVALRLLLLLVLLAVVLLRLLLLLLPPPVLLVQRVGKRRKAAPGSIASTSITGIASIRPRCLFCCEAYRKGSDLPADLLIHNLEARNHCTDSIRELPP